MTSPVCSASPVLSSGNSWERLRELVTQARTKRVIEIQKKKPETPFQEIEFGTKLKEIPKCYLPLVLSFAGYLADTKECSFKIHGTSLSTGETTKKIIPYIHRWTEVYRKSIIAKLYQLEHTIGEEQNNVTMITLTVYQRGISPFTCLSNLKRAYRCLMDVIRHTYGTVDYFWILEPHKTGYAHMHLVYWRVLSETEQEHIRNLWERKYQVGKEGIGVAFSLPGASEDGTYQGGSIAKVRSYLIKYLSKGLYKRWEPAEFLFNAVLWKTKTRMWGCSRHFSKIMEPEMKDKDEDWQCDEVYKLDSANPENKQLIWSRELKKDHCSENLVDCKNETMKGVWTDSDYWERKKRRDIWILDQIFKAEKAELLGMFVPFWKRAKNVN